jgi:hypothetical protein
MAAATFRQLIRLMIMYTANTTSSGSPTERTISATPSRAPISRHLRQDGTGSHSSSVVASMIRNRNGTSDRIRCSSWTSNPS